MIYADHDNHQGRVREVVETQNIFARRHRRKPCIPANAVIDMPVADLSIHPYLLGVWLGDGNSCDKWVSGGRDELNYLRDMAVEVRQDRTAYRLHLKGLETQMLRKIGVLKNKHIPECYLLADEKQRRSLLQGLMDTDGYINERGTCEFCQKDGRLAEDVYVLIRSLGYKATFHKYTAKLYGKECGTKVRICFNPDKYDRVFRMLRKQAWLTGRPRKTVTIKGVFSSNQLRTASRCG